jgi:hypothetical protein
MKNHIDFGPYNEIDLALSENSVKLADTKDIPPSHMKEVEVNGQNICVANVEGKYYAIGSFYLSAKERKTKPNLAVRPRRQKFGPLYIYPR